MKRRFASFISLPPFFFKAAHAEMIAPELFLPLFAIVSLEGGQSQILPKGSKPKRSWHTEGNFEGPSVPLLRWGSIMLAAGKALPWVLRSCGDILLQDIIGLRVCSGGYFQAGEVRLSIPPRELGQDLPSPLAVD